MNKLLVVSLGVSSLMCMEDTLTKAFICYKISSYQEAFPSKTDFSIKDIVNRPFPGIQETNSCSNGVTTINLHVAVAAQASSAALDDHEHVMSVLLHQGEEAFFEQHAPSGFDKFKSMFCFLGADRQEIIDEGQHIIDPYMVQLAPARTMSGAKELRFRIAIPNQTIRAYIDECTKKPAPHLEPTAQEEPAAPVDPVAPPKSPELDFVMVSEKGDADDLISPSESEDLAVE